MGGDATDRGVESGTAAHDAPRSWRVRLQRGRRDAPAPALTLPGRLGTRREEHFVGRASELAALERCLIRVAAGERVVACVTGEPGIGKTRLAAEAGALAHDAGARVLYGRAEQAVGVAYQPFVDALDDYAAALPAAERARHLADRGIVDRMLVGPGGPERATAALTEPGAERYVLFGAVTATLAAIAAQAPLALVLDDLHWADEPTVLMLRHLVERSAELPLLLVLVWRDTDVDEDHPLDGLITDLAGEPRVERLDLRGLADDEVAGCVDHFVGGLPPAARASVAREVADRTAGNPLFVGEMLRHIVERDEGRAAADGSIAQYGWPASVREVVRRRVTRMGDGATRALEAASVVGGAFDAELIAACTGQDIHAVEGDLGRACDGGLLAPVAERPSALVFVHVVVAGALYDALPVAARGRLHRRIAELLAERTTGAAPSMVAWHWLLANPADDERALESSAAAGRAALDALSPHEGLRWYREAVAAAERRGIDDRARCDALLGMGEAERDTGEAGYRETLLRTARMALDLGEDDLLVRSALANHRGFASNTGEVDGERLAILEAALDRVPADDDVRRAHLLATVAAELAFSGDWDRRVAASDAAVQAARRAGDPATLSRVLSARFVPLWMPETLAERLDNTEEAVRQADLTDSPAVQFEAIHWRAAGLIEAGELPGAEVAARRQNALAERLGQPTALWMATYDRANLAIIHGRLTAAEELAGAALAIATDSRQPDALPFYASQIANIRYEQGRLGELQELLAQVVADNPGIPAFRGLLALSLCESGMADEAAELLADEASDAFGRIPNDVTWMSTLTIFAEVCARVGTPAVATLLSDLLEPWSGHVAFTGIGSWGVVAHALGRLAARRGDAELALRRFEEAEAMIGRVVAPVWAARLCIDEAEVRTARSRGDDRALAVTLVDRGLQDAQRLGAAGVERRAVALEQRLRSLDALGGSLPGRLAARGAGIAQAPRADAAAEQTAEYRFEGDVWCISNGGAEFRLADSLGMRHLARLLSDPGRAFAAIELVGAPADRGPGGALEEGLTIRGAGRDGAGPALDEQAKRAYRERIVELREELDEADAFHDPERAASARSELDFLAAELAAAVGLGGRDRPTGSSAERARVNATRAIRRAIARIAEHDPGLGRELDAAVRTGALCSYDPPPHLRLQWRVELPAA